METKIFPYIFGVLAITLLLYSHGWTQPKPGSNAPIITNTFAVDKGYYGYVWKIYIEAEDPTGDMHKIVSTVDQPGWGPYFPDIIMVKSKDQHHLKGYIQWNTFSKNAVQLRDFTPITLRVSILDKAGNESNAVIFPFQFVSRDAPKFELPSPFSKDDKRLGYVTIDLYDPFAPSLEVPEFRR
jgi:hypothetical protein